MVVVVGVNIAGQRIAVRIDTLQVDTSANSHRLSLVHAAVVDLGRGGEHTRACSPHVRPRDKLASYAEIK